MSISPYFKYDQSYMYNIHQLLTPSSV